MPGSQVQSASQSSLQIPHPSGLWRAMLRFPILLYRMHLGRLLGKRFLLLEHRGRKTGLVRRTVIEVVDHDEKRGSYVVAAAWGNQSDWYRNIEAEPNVTVEVGGERFSALARTLPGDEAAQHLNTYATRHPFAFRQLGSRLIGSESHDPAQIARSLVEAMPFVEFSPAPDKAA